MSRFALALACLACTVRSEPDVDSQKLRSLAKMLQELKPPAAFSAGNMLPAHARNPSLNRHRASAAARLAPARNPKMAVTTIQKDALAAVRKLFPTAENMDDYIVKLQAALSTPQIGINKENSIPITTLSRDESVRPLQGKIESVFGPSFNTHGLAGLAHLGPTGMKAAMSHSPSPDGKERYVFFAISQVAIDREGNVGETDQARIEMELLSIIKDVVDPAKADYAVVTGVQIHDSRADPRFGFLAPSKAFAMVGGEEQPLFKRGGLPKTAVTAALACAAGVACGVVR